MKFKELDIIVAKRNINERVVKGTDGCIMMVFNSENFLVEFFVDSPLGNSDDLLTVSIDDIAFHPQSMIH